MMQMKKAIAVALISLMMCFSFFTLSTVTCAFTSVEPVVGVREGDWMEYTISSAGTGNLPPSHDVIWMRMEVLTVDEPMFFTNVTVKYANGIMGSAVWTFNFVEGNTEGWTIIPANLSAGETFFDSYIPGEVIIQREEQKTVLGASRSVIIGSDELREIKEWDKTTGFFISSIEVYKNATNSEGYYIGDLRVTIQAVATNLWDRQISGLEQSVFALVMSGLVFIVVLSVSAVIIWQRENLTKLSLRYPLLLNRVIPAVIIIVAVVFTATVVPLVWMNMGLRNAEVNMIMQTLWLSLILASFAFRRVNKYFIHGILMTAVVIATLIGFASVILMWTPADSASMDVYFSSPVKIAEFIAHGVLSIPALITGAWFVALWRPNSTTFPDKSSRLVKILLILWTLSYIAGLIGYIVDYTTLLGLY